MIIIGCSMSNILLEKKTLSIIKIISVLSAVFLTGIEVFNQTTTPIFSNDNPINLYSLQRFSGNTLTVMLLIILSIKPQKLGLLAICSFYYSLSCSIFDLNNPMSICMFFLGICILYVRGEFLLHTKRKIILIFIIYILMTLAKIHFGIDVFFEQLLYQFGYTLVLGIIFLLFIITIQYQKTPKKNVSKILNLADYLGLVKNDVLLLKEVLAKKQYKEIAIDLYRAEGTIRNRLNKIYDILGVMDRMGFISTYIGYEIVFQKDELEFETNKPKTFVYKKK